MRRRAFLASAAAPLVRGQEPTLGERAMRHVRFLASLGHRLPGSPGDLKAREYIREHMKQAGLSVSVEPFEYQGFDLFRTELIAGDRTVNVKRLMFDPYSGKLNIQAQATFADPDRLREASAKGCIGITTEKANIYVLAEREALAWVQLNTEDYNQLKASGVTKISLRVEGKPRTVRTANVAGLLAARRATDEEILITAHMDSVNTPGAQDNASGTSVLLELTRMFAKSRDLPINLRFVALAAEEAGLLGARAFLQRHEQEQSRWKMMFNIDSVGGSDGPYVQLGGIEPAPSTPLHKLPLVQDSGPAGDWAYQRAYSYRGNVPPWLEDVIKAAAAEAGISFKPSRGMGSDHQVFASAGVAATNIAIGGLPIHTPEDKVDKINPAGLETAARFVEAVVRRASAPKTK